MKDRKGLKFLLHLLHELIGKKALKQNFLLLVLKTFGTLK
ncbi:hypothetical protein BMETH_174_2 [methanotrophic bacterial endosymbiont of Bathymodiolus sp.]|nr:hypothetical protein BMETH_174_2 [methanotrophic bacterial endosymbiont of Bathymodiolus sp.]